MASRGTVLAYHALGACPQASDPGNLFVPIERFEQQMAYLARRHRVVALETIVRGAAPSRAVAITFDDGFRSVLTAAAPVLRRHGFAATVFVPSKWIGGRSTSWYDAPGCETELMDGDELREAERAGIEIASHGSEHLDLGRAAPEQVDRDLDASIEQLTAVLGRRPRYLAYPYGRHSQHARRAAEERFEAAFAIDEPHGGPYAFERVGVTRLDGGLVFAVKASGRYVSWRRSKLGSGAYSLARPLVRAVRRGR